MCCWSCVSLSGDTWEVEGAPGAEHASVESLMAAAEVAGWVEEGGGLSHHQHIGAGERGLSDNQEQSSSQHPLWSHVDF